MAKPVALRLGSGGERERLAGFKCPRSIDVHETMPREATGKLKKRHLRDVYWEGRERAI